MKTNPLAFGVLVIIIITVVGMFLLQDQRISGEPIVIGATMSLSGGLATQGSAANNGYLLCEQHINEDGGLLGQRVQFLIYDDTSDNEIAIASYQRLIVDDGVDLILGPYGSTLTEAVAPVTEQHQMVHISPLAATTSIWEQGRTHLFMVLPPAELFLAGLIEMASKFELNTVAVIAEDALFPRAAANGAVDLAVDKGMDVVLNEVYSRGMTDFSELINSIEELEVEVVAMAASTLSDFEQFVIQMKELDVNVKMFGTSGAVAQFQQSLGADAEYVYGLSAWEPSLPNPGIDRFVEDYIERFGIEPSFHAAGAYGSCQLLVKAVEETQSLDSDQLRLALLDMEAHTVFGHYAVDDRGYQIANSGLQIQWQDGLKEIVWPNEVATSTPRFPTPVWAERDN